MAKTGLGRGIGALIGDTAKNEITHNDSINNDVSTQKEPSEIPIILIDNNPDQPRQIFEDEELQSLAESIKTYGMLQPIVVRPTSNGRYTIISGERRWRASKLAKLSSVPVIIRDVSDRTLLEMSLVENIQRVDLNPLEQAFSMQTLMQEFGMTQVQLSERLSKNRTTIANLMRLLNLAIPVQQMIRLGQLTEGQARPLIGLSDELQIETAKIIYDKKLSARQCEELCSRLKNDKDEKSSKKISNRSQDMQLLEDLFRDSLGVKVKAKGTNNRGTITISCFSKEDIVRIYDFLKEFQDYKKLTE